MNLYTNTASPASVDATTEAVIKMEGMSMMLDERL